VGVEHKRLTHQHSVVRRGTPGPHGQCFGRVGRPFRQAVEHSAFIRPRSNAECFSYRIQRFWILDFEKDSANTSETRRAISQPLYHGVC